LVVECYLYVRLATIMAKQPTLSTYDPFFRQKGSALTKSMAAAADIAVALQGLLEQHAAAAAAVGSSSRMEVHFGAEAKERMYQLFQVCWFWGGGGAGGTTRHLTPPHPPTPTPPPPLPRYALWGREMVPSMVVVAAPMDGHCCNLP
jgi:hypothetical protein